MKTQSSDSEQNKQVSSFRDTIGAKKQQHRLAIDMTLWYTEEEDIFVDIRTNLLVEKMGKKYVVVSHLYDDRKAFLSKQDINICDLNGWEYHVFK